MEGFKGLFKIKIASIRMEGRAAGACHSKEKMRKDKRTMDSSMSSGFALKPSS